MCKLPTPPKYERYYYKGSDRKAANRYNKHHITFKHESRELVVYDKTYQIVENGLQLDEEKLRKVSCDLKYMNCGKESQK